MLIYLGGQIDSCNPDSAGWKQTAAMEIVAHGDTAYDPGAAFSWGGSDADCIIAINEEALRHAGVFLCQFRYAPTFGGWWREVENMLHQRKPVILWGVSPEFARRSVNLGDKRIVTCEALHEALALLYGSLTDRQSVC